MSLGQSLRGARDKGDKVAVARLNKMDREKLVLQAKEKIIKVSRKGPAAEF